MSEGWEAGGRHGRGGVDPRTLPRLSSVEVPYRRIARLFSPYGSRLAAAFGLSVVAAGLSLLPPLAMKEIVDVAVKTADTRLLLGMASVLVAAPLLAGMFGVVQDRQNAYVGQAVMRDLRLAMFRAVERQGVEFFAQTKAGELVQRLTGDVHFVQGVVTGTLVEAATQLVAVVATLVILFVLDWRLAVLAAVIVPLFALPLRQVNRSRRTIRLEAQRARSEMAGLITEVFGVSGALLARVFSREDHVEARFSGVNEHVMGLELRFAYIARWFALLTSTLAPLATAALFLYGGLRVMHHEMTIGAVIAFAAYLAQLLGPTAKLFNVHVDVSAAAVVFVRLFEVLDLPPPFRSRAGVRLGPVEGRIALRDVSYRYPGGPRVLEHVSFDIAPGSVVALVGPSGAGKSTLALLLARLVDAEEGTITVDGVDVKDVEPESLRRQVVFVPQDPFLFHTTLEENLRFARPDASDADMRDALRRARLGDVVEALPAKLETIVGERGHRFSGGERQRIAIARAMLADPRVLVLDEATAHLDAASESAVRDAVAALMAGRTTVVIAHRLSTIVSADDIVVLDHGRVVERGTHRELLERGGVYKELYRTQELARDA